jgi:hypothetical protein
MQPMNTPQALSQLRQAGWQEIAIKRLTRFRRAYTQTELDQAQLDPKRLAFVRWLVTTGRLTEQLPTVSQASDAPPRESRLWLKSVLVSMKFALSMKWLSL